MSRIAVDAAENKRFVCEASVFAETGRFRASIDFRASAWRVKTRLRRE